MPTYEAIQREVTMTAGFVPKTCWIAQFSLSGKERSGGSKSDDWERQEISLPCGKAGSDYRSLAQVRAA